MKSQKGSVHVIIAVILVIAILGALGWVAYTHFINPPKTASTATTSVRSEPQQAAKLNDISTKLSALDYISNKNPINSGPNNQSTILSKTDNPTIFLTTSSSLRYTFHGSQYGIADHGLPTTQVDSILIDAGLANTYTSYLSPAEHKVYTAVYESDLAVCNVDDSIGDASVTCANKDSVTAAESAVSDALTALKAQHPYIASNALSVRYLISSDKTITAVSVDNLLDTNNSDEYDALAVNTSNSWKYVASDTAGSQGLKMPACSILANADYKDVFIDIAPATCFPAS